MTAVHGKDYRILFDEVIKVYKNDFDAARLEIHLDILCCSLQDKKKHEHSRCSDVCISNPSLLQNILYNCEVMTLATFDFSKACNKIFVRAFIFQVVES